MSATDTPRREPRKPVRRQSAALRAMEEARLHGSADSRDSDDGSVPGTRPRSRLSASVKTAETRNAETRGAETPAPGRAAIAPRSSAVPDGDPPGQSAPVSLPAVVQAAEMRAAEIARGVKDALPAWRMPRLQAPRLRLLPAMIFAAVIMLGFRVGDFWTHVTSDTPMPLVAPSLAQEAGEDAGGGPAGREEARRTDDPRGAGGARDEAASGQPEAGQRETSAPRASEARPIETAARAEDAGRALPTPRPEAMTESELELLQSLAARRETLDARERSLDQRAALLEVAEQRIDEKMSELQALRAQLQALLVEVDEQEEAHLASLVEIYENMRPGDAANIFDGLEMDVLISVLDRMREQKAAAILASMSAERARSVTSELAMRQQLPELPEE